MRFDGELITAKTVIFFKKVKIGYLGQIALAKNENFRDGRAKCGDKTHYRTRFQNSEIVPKGWVPS